MKKGIIAFGFLILIFLGFASASVILSEVVRNDNVQAKDIISGSDSDEPYVRSVFNIHKGWNLVPVVENGREPSRTRNTFYGYGNEILGCSLDEAFSTWQIKYQFTYVPGKGYIGGVLDYNTGKLKEPVKSELGNALKEYYLRPEMGGEEGIYSMMFTSQWFYSDMDCSYSLDSFSFKNLKNNKLILEKAWLSEGWNLISIMPGFLNDKFGDSLGDCKILKVNKWGAANQEWEYSSSESEQIVDVLLDTVITEESLYVPLAVKVESRCKLGKTFPLPPALP